MANDFDGTAPAGAPHKSLVHTVPEVCAQSRVSRNRLYLEIKAGRLRIIKIGRRTLISDSALRDWLQSLEGGRVNSALVAEATAASVAKRFGMAA